MVLERKRPSSLTCSELAPRGEATTGLSLSCITSLRCKLDSSPSGAQLLTFNILLRRITLSLPTVTTGPRQQWRRQLLPACPVPHRSPRTSCRRCQPPPSSRSSSATSTMPLLGVYGQGQRRKIWRRARRSSSCPRYAHRLMAWHVRGAHEHLLTGRVDRLSLPAY